MRQLFYPDSLRIPVGQTREGLYAPHVLTVDGWIDAVKKHGAIFLRAPAKGKDRELRTYRPPLEHL